MRSYNVDSALWNEKDLFDCDAYSGETYPVAPGLYEITVSLEGPGVLSSETFVFEDFYSIYNGEISFVSEAQFVF